MKSESLLKEHLYLLEEKLLKPEIRTSQIDLNNILADNFFEIGSSGKMLYKEKGIDEIGLGLVKMKLSDFEIHPLSEEIILTTYRIFDEIKNQHSLRSSIWKLKNDRWQMSFHQGTKTSDSL